MEEEVREKQPWAKVAWCHPKLEEARADSQAEAAEGVWPCWHLGFGLPASRTVKITSFVSATRFVVTYYGSSRKLTYPLLSVQTSKCQHLHFCEMKISPLFIHCIYAFLLFNYLLWEESWSFQWSNQKLSAGRAGLERCLPSLSPRWHLSTTGKLSSWKMLSLDFFFFLENMEL